MGSTSEPNKNVLDATVGGLVWVRRRNGSWWPGRIMNVDELSESCLVSPRSGTPVKLLGREDASVDWYNLEKSKRVKAFRCGEYDECIEKAKASAANSSKKVVKYARREDAILHALELESAHQSKDRPGLCSKMDTSGGEQSIVNESPAVSHSSTDTECIDEESSSLEDDSSSAMEFSQSGVSFEKTNQVNGNREQFVQGRRRKTPNDSEDDGMEGVKRMRGLEDLGIGVVSSLKRKRSQLAHVHEFLKRKSRRRPLTKVLESTAMVSVPVICEQLPSQSGSPLPGMSESKVSGPESNESKRSFSVVLNNSDSTGISYENCISLNAPGHTSEASLINYKQKENEISSMSGLPENESSDQLFDVPFVGEEKHATGSAPISASCSNPKPQGGAGGQSSQSSQVETVSLGNEELNESGSTSSGAADIDSTSWQLEKGSSEWQSKGKRNIRSKSRRQGSRKSVNLHDESNTYLSGLEHGDVFSIGSGLKVDLDHRSFKESDIDMYQGWHGNISHKLTQAMGQTADMKLFPRSAISQRSLPYRHSRFIMNPKYQTPDFPVRYYGGGSTLYDVNLEVKSSYRPQHVPYISLMSKLNGQPIIGHPLTVEVLSDGFCDNLLIRPEFSPTSSCELDEYLEENVDASKGFDTDYEPTPNLGGGRSYLKRKSTKSRKNGLLSKKTRKLSSLTGSHGQAEYWKKPVIIKIKGPSVACVPLKVVFSRINASFNGSMPLPHRTASSK